MHGQTVFERPKTARCRGDRVGRQLQGDCRAVRDRAVDGVKWSKRVRETGSATPAKFGGHRTSLLEPHRAFVLAQLKEVPHLTLHRLKDLLAARGIAVSHDTVWRFLRRQGRSFKKNRIRQ